MACSRNDEVMLSPFGMAISMLADRPHASATKVPPT
jgi:hypothetical protein